MSNIKLSAIEVEIIRRMRGSIGCPADIRHATSKQPLSLIEQTYHLVSMT